MSVSKIWNSCLAIIKESVDSETFNTWFIPIKPLSLKNNNLTVEVPSQYFYEWIEANYTPILAQAIRKIISKKATLSYSVIVDQGSPKRPSSAIKYSLLPPSKQYNSKYYNPFAPKVSNFKMKSNLKSDFNFKNFIEGEHNRFARTSCLVASNSSATHIYNPLLIYGSVGIGKTHLIHALGNNIKSKQLEKKVLFVTSEQFTNQFITAISQRHINDFLAYYEYVDVLIIDDIQFLADKQKTQEVFFNIFNQLYLSGKLIVMTSDRLPSELRGLTDRLVDRFNSGLVVKIEMPKYDTRLKIIRKKIELNGTIDIPEDVIKYIALHIKSSVRDLEGVITSIIAHASYSGKEITLSLAQCTLRNIMQNIEKEVNIDYIARFVAENYGVNIEKMSGGSRKREITMARQVAMFMCKEYTEHTYKMIGNHFGGRDHSTVIHAIRTVRDRMDVDSKFNEGMQKLRRILTNTSKNHF